MYTVHTPYTTPHQEVLSLIVDGSNWSLGGHSLLQSPGYISQPFSEFILTGFVGLGERRERGGEYVTYKTSVNCHIWTRCSVNKATVGNINKGW